MLFTSVLATLVATAAAAKDRRTFAVLHHYGRGPLTTCRADPILSPGGPSSHVHTVMGASNFGLNVTGELLRQSECTTALPKADLSAYWFPTLYFQDPETNLLEPVDMYYMNVYYFFEPTNDDIKAFPLGLKMVSGDPMLRTAPSDTGALQLDPSKGPIQPVQITCPRTSYDPPSYPPDSDGSWAGIVDPYNPGSGIGFPFQDCDTYASPMRVDVHFPSCYNPEAGVEDFRNNMRFPTDAGNGKQDCPPGWIHTPHIFYETYWDTHKLLPRFQDLLGKKSPFVFSNGDVTGFSAHADFISGWDEEELQHIIDTCDAGHAGIDKCPGLKYGVNDPSTSCNIKCPIDEVVDGKLEKLPGNNPLAGWGLGGASSSGSPSQSGNDQSGSASGSNSDSASAPASGSSSSSSSSSTPAAATETPLPTTLIAVPTSARAKEQPAAEEEAEDEREPTPALPTPTLAGARTATLYNTVTVWQTRTVYERDVKSPAPTQGAAEQPASGEAPRLHHARRHLLHHARMPSRRYRK
ncbi:hypothetical protein VTH06DRAFT_3615 [Thermothelomyces fergusii]